MDDQKQSTTKPAHHSGPAKRFTIGLLTAESFTSYAPDHWLGVLDAAQEQDVNVICFFGENIQAPKRFQVHINPVTDIIKALDTPGGFDGQASSIFELISASAIDGLIVWTSVLNWFTSTQAITDFCKRYQLPVVSAEVLLPGIPSVLIDDFGGMYSTISHLIEVHGHRRVAFLRGPENHLGAQQRYRGYLAALSDHGLAFDPNLVSPPTMWDGRASSMVLLDDRGLRPQIDFDALVGANDGFVTRVHAFFEERGIRVPNDVAVAGFDNIAELRAYTPTYTTVDPQVYAVGQRALEQLLILMRGEAVPESLIVPSRLIVGRSCGCPDRAVMLAGAEASRSPNAQPPVLPISSAPLEVIFATRRAETLDAIVQASGIKSEQAAQLLDAFSTSLQHATPEPFLSKLETLLRQLESGGHDPASCHDAVSALRRALHSLDTGKISSQIEAIWQQAHVLISEMARRAQTYRMMQAEQQSQMLREVAGALLDVYDLPELTSLLAQSLPLLGIPSAYLACYDHSHSVSEWSRLIMACGPGWHTEFSAEGQRFRSCQLAPDGLLPQDRRYSLVAEPLYFRERHLGFVLLEAVPREAIVYETLREAISHALYSDWLLGERQRAEEALRRHAIDREIHQREQRRRAMLERVVRVGKAIAQVTDVRTCLLDMYDIVLGELEFDRVGLWLYDASEHLLRGSFGTTPAGDMAEEWHRAFSVAENEGFRRVLNQPDGFLFNADYEAVDPPNPDPNMVGVKQHAMAAAWVGDKPIAIIAVDNLLTHRPMTEEQLEALRLFAGYAGLAIENARLLEQARQSEQKYRSIFENSVQGVAQSTLEGRFLSANAATARMLGYASPEELIASVNDIQADVFVDSARRDEMRRLLEEQGVVRDFEFQFRRKDGQLAWGSLNAWIVRSGQDTRIESTVQDITERRQLEAQLLKAQKMEAIGQLAGGIAHDFNNLLVVIAGNADLASATLAHDAPALADLREIQHATERAANLTRQLLTFARRQPTTPQTLDLNNLILDIDKMLRRLIRENITLHTSPAPDLWPVQADPVQIEQVLVNLAVNARDAMPHGGKLAIETANVVLDPAYSHAHPPATPGPYVLLAVTDTGVGMSADVQRHAFEPFFTTKEQGQGTGLGLATCYGIVSQHSGMIQLYSEVGIGTSVKVYLPRAKEATATPPSHQEPGQIPRGTELMLLVEDEPAVRMLAARILRQQGYAVLEAANGIEALDVVEKHTGAPIDLLLTDMVMPSMGGYELAQRLRRRIPGLRVMFMSGYTDNAVVQNGLLEPGITFLQKPFTVNELARNVRAVLDR